MITESKDKVHRILYLYSKLQDGQVVSKAEMAIKYGVNERSIQRDIDDIRDFLEIRMDKSGIFNTVIYDRSAKGYRLEQENELKLTNSEILAICKILIDSRALTKEEMTEVLKKLVDCCVPDVNKKLYLDGEYEAYKDGKSITDIIRDTAREIEQHWGVKIPIQFYSMDYEQLNIIFGDGEWLCFGKSL